MPLRRRYKRRRVARRVRRGVVRRRTAGGRRRRSVVWKKNGFPNSMYITMAYTDVISLDPGVGGGVSKPLLVNSIFNPGYASSAGHQPFGYDQWLPIYNKYKVMKTVVTAQVLPTTQPPSNIMTGGNQLAEYTPNYSGIFFLKSDDDATITLSSAQAIMEQQQTRYCMFTNGKWSRKLSMVYTPRSVPNVGKDLTAIMTANPAEQAFIHVGLSSLTGDNLVQCKVVLRMKFFVKLFDRKDVNNS